MFTWLKTLSKKNSVEGGYKTLDMTYIQPPKYCICESDSLFA